MNVNKGTRLPADPLKGDSKLHLLTYTHTVIIRATRLHYYSKQNSKTDFDMWWETE